MTIFEKALAGEMLDRQTDPRVAEIDAVQQQTAQALTKLNQQGADPAAVHTALSQITGHHIPDSTTISLPFGSDFGHHIWIGERVFINRNCTMVDVGGIEIQDDVLIGPNVQLLSVNHPLDKTPALRHRFYGQRVVIQRNAWLGAGVTILPGVTVGENAVVAAGAVVTHDVAPNTIVGGVPAKFIKAIPD
ncbi:DapH/DapD/GlmU-related protein [Lactiplantibacillus fabifermentans]|uniref:Galactoside O-acetyltransferase n=2 Tax=Lactiplantibacillus fabifermentans TaxID=483011 RepID=A0A0R2NMP7_9LACO|nr:DapH/DapD/GlmU-related protein [Lactiplantibacillus fabifermentans]ETY74336.1 nodulation protein L [Lactiplantibacillus fabifermentans T30PCM01]KRO27007.1 galactoside O-acetyltransferase [Lactiplantibacillus fabifermentans DSM 21115]